MIYIRITLFILVMNQKFMRFNLVKSHHGIILFVREMDADDEKYYNVERKKRYRCETGKTVNNVEDQRGGENEKEESMILDLKVLHAIEIDETNINAPNDIKSYNVIISVSPDECYVTHVTKGLPNPVWNEQFYIRVDGSLPFLDLEVIRMSPLPDPGPSHGMIVVGRTRVPLPRKNSATIGIYELLRSQGAHRIFKGYIILSVGLF